MESMERILCQKAGLSIYFVVCIWFVSSVIRFLGWYVPAVLSKLIMNFGGERYEH